MNKVEKIKIITDDDVTLIGNFFTNKSKNAVVLLHQFKTDKNIYNDLAIELQKKNFNVLAIDFRGHGESDGDFNNFTDKDFQNMFYDVKSAVDYLLSIDKSFYIQMIGSSIGANTALSYIETKTLKSVILLSPSFDYHSIKTKNGNLQNTTTPIFYINSEYDSSKKETEKLYEQSPVKNSLSKLKIYNSDRHGYYILQSDPQAKEDVINWLIQHKLPKNPHFKYE